jgi:hypothetical protein
MPSELLFGARAEKDAPPSVEGGASRFDPTVDESTAGRIDDYLMNNISW